jgi:phosphate starvation-inducible membrane PsiE
MVLLRAMQESRTHHILQNILEYFLFYAFILLSMVLNLDNS